ncbi:protein artemis-like [Episyrphus balteatus]|uniref:protein artemis-like n=1 Tax=Episyrphus balteatus TaxID=286459 RepID=UPI002484F243|nr:protein artemis-like [Episyrphus balteatus]
MSTFMGIFDEIPGIAVDRFDADCLKSNYLFLSHCHADHMVGLSEIVNLSIPLITSEISAVFLKHQFPNISNAIETIEIESPLELKYILNGNEIELIVTALPAKHCPGSVMFLFETTTQTVLYTGDCRILPSHFQQYDILKNKTVDSIHLDSTFLSERFYEFPTQYESISEICSLIHEWLEMHYENKVLIEMPAQYGVEFLFMAIEQKLGQKIYVNEKQWQKYVYLPAMDHCISPDASKCRIFTKFKGFYGTYPDYPLKKLRVIKPSAMFWKDWKRGEPIVMQVGDKNEYRVAYSNHCSCLELKQFLEFIKPKRVSLNVVPDNCRLSYANCLNKIYVTNNETIITVEKEDEISFDSIFFLPNPCNLKRNNSEAKLLPKRLKS